MWDTLDTVGSSLPLADVILTNPPFGTKRGAGLPGRSFPFPTSNKQLAFLQHIYLGLKPGGRAAVIMPELMGPAAKAVCGDLMEKCRLHTVLRLPVGIFYAPGVKTNALFFERGRKAFGNTADVWIYDLRFDMPNFGKRTPLTREHFRGFEKAFGSDRSGCSKRSDQGEMGRFRRFTREQIRDRGDNFDMSWLKDDSASIEPSRAGPDKLIAAILERFGAATRQIEALKDELAKS